MFYTPNYLVFRVRINDKEYFGRMKHGRTSRPFGITAGTFRGYRSLLSSMGGGHGEEIEITSNDVIGLEVIDINSSKAPSGISKILAACNEIQNVPSTSNETTALIDNLISALQEFNDEHRATVLARGVIDKLDDIKVHFENEIHFQTKAKELKEMISFQIQKFFQELPDERINASAII
jgi:hypothetical protein